MLAICTYMTKVALDGRILGPEAEDYEGSKINQCVKRILEINRENPKTAQVVFCDTNTPKYDGKFTVYEDIKQKLIESGQYKPEEIAFVHDAKNDKQRIEMFEKVNEAKIRLIIGSTGKLGTGVNIQRSLIAMHHLDAPYRPSEVEPIQRNFLSNFIIKIINQACRRTYSKHQVSEYAHRQHLQVREPQSAL